MLESGNRDLDPVRKAFGKLATFGDASTGWVSPVELRAWPAVKNDRAWQLGFDEMIRKAAPYGWIDPLTGAIKAHVEWINPPG